MKNKVISCLLASAFFLPQSLCAMEGDESLAPAPMRRDLAAMDENSWDLMLKEELTPYANNAARQQDLQRWEASRTQEDDYHYVDPEMQNSEFRKYIRSRGTQFIENRLMCVKISDLIVWLEEAADQPFRTREQFSVVLGENRIRLSLRWPDTPNYDVLKGELESLTRGSYKIFFYNPVLNGWYAKFCIAPNCEAIDMDSFTYKGAANDPATERDFRIYRMKQ